MARTLRTVSFLLERDPTMAAAFAEWHIDSENNITGILRGGIEVRFGAGDPLALMPKLAVVMNARPDLGRYRCLDLRFEGQVVCS